MDTAMIFVILLGTSVVNDTVSTLNPPDPDVQQQKQEQLEQLYEQYSTDDHLFQNGVPIGTFKYGENSK